MSILCSINPAFADNPVNNGISARNDLQPGMCGSIFKISDYRNQGVGVLIDKAGLILTLKSYTYNENSIRVWIDDSSKVGGQLLASDYKSNLAVIRIHPEFVKNLPAAEIAASDTIKSIPEKIYLVRLGRDEVVAGLNLSAISDSLFLLRDRLDISLIGYPLFNENMELFSEITGINKIGSSDSTIIRYAQKTDIEDIIKKAKRKASWTSLPDSEFLPHWPDDRCPISSIENYQVEMKKDSSLYFFKQNKKKQNFKVKLFTPQFAYYYFALDTVPHVEESDQIAETEDMNIKRERDVSLQNIFDKVITTNYYLPVVLVTVEPILTKQKERKVYTDYPTGKYIRFDGPGAGSNPESKFEWQVQKALLRDCFIEVNGNRRLEIDKKFEKIPIETYSRAKSYYWKIGDFSLEFAGDSKKKEEIEMVDIGYLVIPVDFFAPDENDYPEIVIEITSVDFPGRPDKIKIPRKTIERIWSDFEYCHAAGLE